MKSKLLLALASLIIGMTTFTANSAYADMTTSSMTGQSHCEDWSYKDPKCPAYIPDTGGKAAFGASTDKPMVNEKAMKNCVDWDYNVPGCPGYIGEQRGKPAFGEPKTDSGDQRIRFCSTEGMNVIDKNCGNDIPK